MMAPRLIELCFQTAGLWEMGLLGRMGLPQQVGRVSVLRTPDSTETRLFAVITPHPDQGYFDAEVVDAEGNCYLKLDGYRTVAIPGAVDGGRLKELQALMSEAVIAA
jgi:hypothetical protein